MRQTDTATAPAQNVPTNQITEMYYQKLLYNAVEKLCIKWNFEDFTSLIHHTISRLAEVPDKNQEIIMPLQSLNDELMDFLSLYANVLLLRDTRNYLKMD